jgi:cell pole-organizing protein PopZ
VTAGENAPSMDAILASIKRIIAEEAETAPLQPLRRVGNPPPPAEPEILELTEEADPLVSPDAAEASRAKLDALSSIVVAANPPGSDTLEGLVREMLRPMLAEWLDAKLPAMVERLVAAEIERITARN